MRKQQINKAAKKFANNKLCKQSCIYSFTKGAEWADSHQVWNPASELPPINEEVIVLVNYAGMSMINFAHSVDKETAISYNGWNIPNVMWWIYKPLINK